MGAKLVSNCVSTTELNAFVSSLRSAGRGVVIWSYYGVPSDAEFGFDRCGAALADLSALQAAAAEGDAGVLWVDGADAISASDDYAFDEDRVHPSAEGSAVIGAQIAEAIRGAESAR